MNIDCKLDIEKEFLALAIIHIIKPSSINKFIENYYRYCLNEVFKIEVTKAIYRKLDLSDDEIIDIELRLYSFSEGLRCTPVPR